MSIIQPDYYNFKIFQLTLEGYYFDESNNGVCQRQIIICQIMNGDMAECVNLSRLL